MAMVLAILGGVLYFFYQNNAPDATVALVETETETETDEALPHDFMVTGPYPIATIATENPIDLTEMMFVPNAHDQIQMHFMAGEQPNLEGQLTYMRAAVEWRDADRMALLAAGADDMYAMPLLGIDDTVGEYFPADEFPATRAFMNAVVSDTVLYAEFLQHEYRRQLPYVAFPDLEPAFTITDQYALPSTYATRAYTLAILWGMMLGDVGESVVEADKMTTDLVDANVHYPSDISAAKHTVEAYLRVAPGSPAFQELQAAAVAELNQNGFNSAPILGQANNELIEHSKPTGLFARAAELVISALINNVYAQQFDNKADAQAQANSGPGGSWSGSDQQGYSVSMNDGNGGGGGQHNCSGCGGGGIIIETSPPPPPPPVIATLEMSTNGGSTWSTADQTVDYNHSGQIRLRWSTQRATACRNNFTGEIITLGDQKKLAVTNVINRLWAALVPQAQAGGGGSGGGGNTGGDGGGGGGYSNQGSQGGFGGGWGNSNQSQSTPSFPLQVTTLSSTGVNVSTPAPGTTRPYTLRCTGTGAADTESVRLTVRQIPPNLQSTYTGFNLSTEFDKTTGAYAQATIRYQIQNVSVGLGAGAFTNQTQFDLGNDGSFDQTDTTNVSSLAAQGITQPLSFTVTDMPFGVHRVSVMADSTTAVTETDETDNSDLATITILPPDPNFAGNPNIGIWADATTIRAGGTTMLHWDTDVTYSMNCIINGPGFAPIEFDPAIDGPAGNRETVPTSNAGTYRIQCTEPITGTVFTESLVIENIGTFQEI